ncbi:DUF1799 domain-containing protein [Pseudacidovorax sp. RU35E]|uniref:DUF1799 domain-containing protein n=1 Tax=Pseudacidovorax sp. RU35E TaxID=1907403 RepID=UPI000953E769|nr:DUF1799 domain-containing protein [Pseudacidovorax sp. RU35E]SIR06687.1 Phage related hypothetical protein [Pseudacidovorax sp. RU35E]
MCSDDARRDAGGFELWEEHVEAFQVFYLCARQWRFSLGFGTVWYEGLDLGAVDVAMRRLRVPDERSETVLLQLRVMEEEGRDVLNAR